MGGIAFSCHQLTVWTASLILRSGLKLSFLRKHIVFITHLFICTLHLTISYYSFLALHCPPHPQPFVAHGRASLRLVLLVVSSC